VGIIFNRLFLGCWIDGSRCIKREFFGQIIARSYPHNYYSFFDSFPAE
jgi:hypothetical protein